MSSTSKLYSFGDVDERGYVFIRYGRDGYPSFLSPAGMHRHRISQAYCHARKRSQRKGIPFDISIDELVALFPSDGRCPVLGLTMTWRTGAGIRPDSPSLDRIVPEKGYVHGNVIWISQRANSIKQNATAEEILAVGRFYSNLKN